MKYSVTSFFDPNQRYQVDTREITCDCPDANINRGAYDRSDPRRLCKHLVYVMVERKEIPAIFADYSDILRELAGERRGFPHANPVKGRSHAIEIVPAGPGRRTVDQEMEPGAKRNKAGASGFKIGRFLIGGLLSGPVGMLGRALGAVKINPPGMAVGKNTRPGEPNPSDLHLR